MIFSTPTPLWIELWLQREFDFHFLIRCVFGTLLGLILEVFWEPKWRPRPSKSHFKKTSKNDAQNEPKMVPKGVPKWSQNRQKWGLGSTLFQGWLPRGLQTPFRIDFGEVLRPFWYHFRQFFWHIFDDFYKHSLATCCKQIRSKSQGITKRMQQGGSRNSFSLRATLHWKVH